MNFSKASLICTLIMIPRACVAFISSSSSSFHRTFRNAASTGTRSYSGTALSMKLQTAIVGECYQVIYDKRIVHPSQFPLSDRKKPALLVCCTRKGLPNVGKSTLFNALTETQGAEAANYPFCTIEPNVGIVEVPDSKLQVLEKINSSVKVGVPSGRTRVSIRGQHHQPRQVFFGLSFSPSFGQ